MHTCKYLTLLNSTELLRWAEKSGKYCNELQYELSLLLLLITHGSKLSEFQSDVPSNTLLLMPNDVQRLEELEIQYSQALAKPERETNSHNRLRSNWLASHSVSLQSAVYKHKFYHNFSPQNNDAHVKVIPRLGVSYSKNKPAQLSITVPPPPKKNKKNKNKTVTYKDRTAHVAKLQHFRRLKPCLLAFGLRLQNTLSL